MIGLGPPIGTGLVQSLARPGGNVTGVSMMAPVVTAKTSRDDQGALASGLPSFCACILLRSDCDCASEDNGADCPGAWGSTRHSEHSHRRGFAGSDRHAGEGFLLT